MLSKFIAWLLSILTALMGNFGFYQNPEKTYTSAGLYSVKEDPVNYADMRNWYLDSLDSDTVCQVKSFPMPNSNQTTGNGFMHIVSGTQLNTSAQPTFSDGAVIIAPTKCKITSEPSSSVDKIVVEAEGQPTNSWWKLEISKPKAWFCCYKSEPMENGRYQHSQIDHKIVLNQGDVLAIASTETELTMWTNKNGSHVKTDSYAEFMYDVNKEFAGDSDANLSGDNAEDAKKNGELGAEAPEIDQDKIFTGEQTWRMGAAPNDNLWWFGNASSWAQNQYVVIDDTDGVQ